MHKEWDDPFLCVCCKMTYYTSSSTHDDLCVECEGFYHTPMYQMLSERIKNLEESLDELTDLINRVVWK